MPDKTRLKLAALMTALFLAAISTAGAIAHSGHAPAQTSSHVMSAQRGGPTKPNFAPPSQEHEHD